MSTRETILALIREEERNGVAYEKDRWHDGDFTNTAIRWTPGDPNALAHAIINNVEGKEMRLVLDGREYMIRRIP